MAPSPRTRKTFLFGRWERWIALAFLAVVVSLRIILRYAGSFGTGGSDSKGEHVLANASSVGEVQSLVSQHCRTDINVLCRRGDCANTPNPILSVLFRGGSADGLRFNERCDSPHPSVVLPGLLPASLSIVDRTLVKTALAPLDGVCRKAKRYDSYYGMYEWCHDRYLSIDGVAELTYVPDSETVQTYGPNWIHDNGSNLTLTGLEKFSVLQNFTQSRETGGPLALQVEFSCCPDDPDVTDPTALASLIPSLRGTFWDQDSAAALVCTPLLCKLGPQRNEKHTGRIALARLWRAVIAAAEDQANASNGYTYYDYDASDEWARIMSRLARLLIISFVELFCNTQTNTADESNHILAVLNPHQQNVFTFHAGEWNKSEVLDIMREASEEYDKNLHPTEGNLTKPVLDFLRSPQDFTTHQHSKFVATSRGHLYDPRLGPTGDYTWDKCLSDHSVASSLITEECPSVMAAALPKIKDMNSQEMNEFQSSFGWFVFGLSIFVLALQYCSRRSSLPGGYAHASVKRERQRGRRRLGECLADDFLRRSIEFNVTKAVGDNKRARVMRKLQLAAEQGYNENGELTEDREKNQRCNAGMILFHHLFVLITFLSGALTLEAYLNVLAVMLAGFIVIAGLEAKDSGAAPSAIELSELIHADVGEGDTKSNVEGKGPVVVCDKPVLPVLPEVEASTVIAETFPNEEDSA